MFVIFEYEGELFPGKVLTIVADRILGTIQKVCHRPRGGGRSSKIVTKCDKGGGGQAKE